MVLAGVDMGYKASSLHDCVCNAWRMCLLRVKRMRTGEYVEEGVTPPTEEEEGAAGMGVAEDMRTPLVTSQAARTVRKYRSDRHAPLLRWV